MNMGLNLMTLKSDESCNMESRIVRLETEQEMIKKDMSDYSVALRENTKSLQELTKIMIRHDEMLKDSERDFSTRTAIFTGIVVGVVILLIDGIVHII